MEFIMDLVGELLFEGGGMVVSNHKISKWIRYPLLILFFGFYGIIILGMFSLSAFLLTKNLFGGIFLFIVSCLFVYALVSMVLKAKRKSKLGGKGDLIFQKRN